MQIDTDSSQYQVPPPQQDLSQKYEVPSQQIESAGGTGQQYQVPMHQMQHPSYQHGPQHQYPIDYQGAPNQYQQNQYMLPHGVNETTPMLPMSTALSVDGRSVQGDQRRGGVSNVHKDRIFYLVIIVFVLSWLFFGGDSKGFQLQQDKILVNGTVTRIPSQSPSWVPTATPEAKSRSEPASDPAHGFTNKVKPKHTHSDEPTKTTEKASKESSTRSPAPEPSLPEQGTTSGSPKSTATHSVRSTYDVYFRDDQYHVISSDDTEDEQESVVNSEVPIASGEYIKNVDGNGWHYFSASVPEFDHTHRFIANDESDGDDHVASNLAIEQYLVAMKGMGYVEGFATCNEMNQWYHNFYAGLFNDGDVMPETLKFLEQNYDWTLAQANANYLISDYWLTVKGVLQQLDGLAAGHSKGCGDMATSSGPNALVGEAELSDYKTSKTSHHSARRDLLVDNTVSLEGSSVKHDLWTLTSKTGASIYHLMLVNANGDMFQIEAKYHMEKIYNLTHGVHVPEDDDIATRVHHLIDAGRIGRRGKRVISPGNGQPDHCSAIVKLTPDNADVTFAHATWDEFQCASPRIVKRYVFPDIKDNSILNSNIDLYFSSSPGLLSSVDDYYHVYKEGGSSQLAIMETSLDVFDRHLLESINPSTVLSWVRSRISSQMGRTAPQWANYFSTFHSGTYTNQWMVLDLMRFTPGSPPEDNFLIILEEMPGFVHWEDMTANFTRDKYWASFNLPYFKDIAVMSGIAEVCRQDATNCYDTDPRSRLFAKYQDLVVDIETTQWMIAYNNFSYDPESLGGACNSISCREDLATNSSIAYPFGAIDGKVSSVNSAKLKLTSMETDSDVSTTKSLRSLSGSKSMSKSNSKLITQRTLPKIYAHMGPSQGGDFALSPFCWAPFDNSTEEHADYKGMRRDRVFSRYGHPECFEYGWQVMPPQAN